MHHCLARSEDAFAVRITSRIGQVADHVLLYFFRGIKAKNGKVAEIKLDDLLAFILHLAGRIHDGSANIVEHISQLGRFLNGTQKSLQKSLARGETYNLTTVPYRVSAVQHSISPRQQYEISTRPYRIIFGDGLWAWMGGGER